MSEAYLYFLKQNPLFNKKYIREHYRLLNDSDIQAALKEYRDFSLNDSARLQTNTSPLSVMTGTYRHHRPDSNFLKQSALYLDQVLIGDPLFEISLPATQYDQMINESIIGRKIESSNRKEILGRVKYILDFLPAIQNKFISLVPVGKIYEPPDEISLYRSENLFREVLPTEILDYFNNHAKVANAVRQSEGGLVIRPDKPLEISRNIAIEFGDAVERSMFFHLSQMEKIDDDNLKLIVTSDDIPVSKATFAAWVEQSINRAAWNLASNLIGELEYTQNFNATYLTTSTFIAGLLKLLQKDAKPSENATLSEMALRLQLPVLEHVSLEKLLKLRQNDGEVFQNFRVELERRLRQIRYIEDESVVAAKLSDIAFEMSKSEILSIERKIKQVKNSLAAETVVVTATLITAISQGGWLSLPALAPLAGVVTKQLFQKAQDASETVRNNPAFFLWKLNKVSKKRFK